ncbi:MAG: FtsX-like permease family protein, partial [Spirosomaceae bacterium]|nr:FtsX-like permease family protein [Spirosomataceae bacterium]
MLKSYVNTIIRHLMRQKLFTLLNVVGLTISICGAWITYTIVQHEYDYNASIVDSERVFKVISVFDDNDGISKNIGTPAPLSAAIRSDVAGVEMAVPVFKTWYETISKENAEESYVEDEKEVILTTAEYFSIVDYEWLAGNAKQAFSLPNQVVLEESEAIELLGPLPVDAYIGQTLVFDDEEFYTVSGIIKDYTKPIDFGGEIFIPFQQEEDEEGFAWLNTSSDDQLLVKLSDPNQAAVVGEQISEIAVANAKGLFERFEFYRTHELIPVSDSHFNQEVDTSYRTTSNKIMLTLTGVAFFLLLLAVVNYINLSTAMIPTRHKEIGIRKSLGSSGTELVLSFMCETLVVVLVATLIAWQLTALFFANFQFDLIDKGIFENQSNWRLLLFLFALVSVLTLASGIYPAWIVTRFKPSQIIRGFKVSVAQKGITLKKSLIVVQFAVAGFFIIGGLVVGKQLQFFLKQDLGFNQQAVVMLEIPEKLMDAPEYENNQYTLLESLKSLKEVESAALGNPPFSTNFSAGSYFRLNDKGERVDLRLSRKAAQVEYVDVYDLKLVAGTMYSVADTMNSYVLNETAVKEFGFVSVNDALGKTIQRGFDKKAFVVCGVVKDFHSVTFDRAIEPVAMMTNPYELGMNIVNLKLAEGANKDLQKSINELKATWAMYYPEEVFAVEFYDTVVQQAYEEEIRLSKLINLLSIVMILISCIGLLGLSIFAAYDRKKEIGIRKVLGANVLSLVFMLARTFIFLVIIAFVIAIPLTYLATQSWLDDYVYRIDQPVMYYV